MTEKELTDKLIEYKDAYYNGEALVSDSEFDELEEQLKAINPDSFYFSMVGISAKGAKQVQHKFPMLSCGKAKTVEQVKSWLKKINKENEVLIAMPKIDGLSGKIVYQNGKAVSMSTRGNGKVGTDITWLLDYIQDVPKEIKTDEDYLEVYGEIYLPKNTEFDIGDRPLRNNATGLVGRKDDREDCKYLHFVAYKTTKYDDSFAMTLDFLKKVGFNKKNNFSYKIMFDTGDMSLNTLYNEYISFQRDAWIFETDGLVLQINDQTKYNEIDSHYVIEHHNFYRWAWKPEAEGSDTILRGIDWQMSRLGTLMPVAVFDTVVLGDREVSRASLFNYDNVKNLDLREGDKIHVILANDVIPYFEKLVEHNKDGKSLLIEKCPFCGSSVELSGVNIKCTSKDCTEKIIQQLTYWCQKSEMDNISESTIRTLVDNGFIYSIKDFYTTLLENKQWLLNVDGLGESKVNNLFKQIEKSKTMTVSQFISKLGIELVGEKAVKKLGIKTLKDFYNFNDKQYVIGENIINFRNENKQFVDELVQVLNIQEEKEKNILSKGTVCMTGTGPKGRKELEKDLQSMGYTSVDSVNKDTSILVCEDVNGTSSKLVRARKLGIKVVSYEEFFGEI